MPLDINELNDFIKKKIPESNAILEDFNGRHSAWNDKLCNT